jgi:glycosyltransferase involved in cell wall biosynthesis
VPELIDSHSGVLYREQAPHVLADHLASLAQDEGRRAALGMAAQQRVASQFRLDTMVERTRRVYKQVQC